MYHRFERGARVAALVGSLVFTFACSSVGGSPDAPVDTSPDAFVEATVDVALDTCWEPLVSCGGVCTHLAEDRQNCGACGNACAGTTVCQNGHCTLLCSPPQSGCGTYCANLNTDNANCGACGVTCPLGQTCDGGHCSVSCSPAQTMCAGLCVSLETDNANCGGCGVGCPAGQVCSGGHCDVSCRAGLSRCGDSCANTQTDNANCGGCGVTCPAGQTCSAGHCDVTCSSGTVRCGAGCANTQTDNANCGACGVVCTGGQSCMSGTCMTTCSSGQVQCGGVCTNTQTDNANCGACGTSCPAGQACTAGHCQVSCGPMLTNCSGGCTNTQSDPINCGACGTVCNPGYFCSAGHCAVTCGTGQSLCGTTCANTNYDPANCGLCGHACVGGSNSTGICLAGSCSTTCLTGFADCDGNAVNGCETDLRGDPRNCGACRNACSLSNASTYTCTGGTCGIGSCYSGYGNCDSVASNGCETYVSYDARNCGGCGVVCALPNTATNYCSYNVCQVSTCTSGWGNCDSNHTNGCETNLNTSLANCGACGRPCALPNATSSACTGGACVFGSCNAGYGNCDSDGSNGCEVNLQRNSSNCGACGTVCPSGTACIAGTCQAATACLSGTAPRVLFFGPLGSYEQPYLPAGSVVTVATDAAWRAMTTADFSTYQLIVFGGQSSTAGYQTLFDTRATWGAAVTGRVVVDGYTGAYSSTPTSVQTYLRNTFTWLTTGLGTALYVTSDRDYRNLDYLSPFGVFNVSWTGTSTVHILQPGHPTMTGLTDTALSGWYWYTGFSAVPSGFDILATATYYSGSYSAIVARDVTCAPR